MRPGKLVKASTNERDLLETVLAQLAAMRVAVDEVITRTRQAQRRTELVADVLEPADLRLAEMRSDLLSAHAAIARYYAAQGGRWRGEEGAVADKGT